MKRSTSSITAALAAAASDPFPFFSSRKSSTEEEAAGDLSQPLTATQNGHEQEGPVQASSAFSTRDSGVIQVSKGRPDRTVDSEMEALRRIPQFKPLLESSLSPAGFSWGGMFGSQPSTPKADEMPYMIDPAPGIALWEKSRAHIERCSSDIARDQKLLEMSMSNMEEYCTKLANTVVNRCYEAKVQGEKMSACEYPAAHRILRWCISLSPSQ
ncbi:hypothetical protein DFJ77DRAFT_225235 [Powellomyces hirtus]|nr:hypothetical protein DFJ77DRAFT_225235 [Powellomyces hirtus]